MKEIIDFIADLIEEEQQIYSLSSEIEESDIAESIKLIVNNCQ